jgi:hypothetical protein
MNKAFVTHKYTPYNLTGKVKMYNRTNSKQFNIKETINNLLHNSHLIGRGC